MKSILLSLLMVSSVFAVDVNFSTDVPNIDKKAIGEADLGKGPIVTRNADINPVLGRKIRIPEAPFALALVSGAPLVVFFALRTGKGQYHFQAARPILLDRTDRKNRNAAIQSAAGRYAAGAEVGVLHCGDCRGGHLEDFCEHFS